MNIQRNRAVLILAPRWWRSRAIRRSSVLLALTFALVAVVFVSVRSLSLTGEQQADKALGRYQQQTSASITLGDLKRGDLQSARAQVEAVAPGTHLFLDSTQIRPDALTKRYVQAPLENLRFVEDPELRDAFPGRYSLEEGVWPAKPSEVVITSALEKALDGADEFTVLSGRATFRVVGRIRDAYAERAESIVAGPGTWESIPRPVRGREYQPVEASVIVLFDSSAREVGPALAEALPRMDRDPATSIEANYSSRSQVSDDVNDAFGADQFTISYVPLALVVLTVSVLVVGQNRRPQRSDADRLVALGVRRSRVRMSQALALLIASSGAVGIGLALGWLVAIALRASALPAVADQPLSPLAPPDAIIAVIAVSAVLLIGAGSLWPAPAAAKARWSSLTGWLADIQVALLRRVAVVLLIVGAVQTSVNARSVTASYLAIAAALLAAPDVLRALVWALPRSSPRALVVSRLMDADRARQAAAVIVVAACIALPISVATQLVSQRVSDASFTFSRVPAGQVWVQSTGGAGDVAGVARAVSRVMGIGDPIVIRGSDYSSDLRDKNSAAAFFETVPTSGRSSSALMIIDSPDDVRRLIGDDNLPSSADDILQEGGVLDFTSAEGDQRFVVLAANGKRLLRTPVLSTLKVRLNKQLSASFGGAVLLETANALNLPVDPPNKFVYPEVTPADTAEMVQAAVDAGYDSEFVQYAVPPPEPSVPRASYVYLAALTLGAFAVLLIAIRGQATRLRRYSARLIAIGLAPNWTRSILGIQAALTVGVGLLAGIVSGILGVKIAAGTYAVTAVPILAIALACAATVIAAALATILALRKLSAAEQHLAT